MRRLLVVATAVAALTIGMANPASAAWREYTHYPDLSSCQTAGQDGVDRGEWTDYYCHYVWGDWLLWVNYAG